MLIEIGEEYDWFPSKGIEEGDFDGEPTVAGFWEVAGEFTIGVGGGRLGEVDGKRDGEGEKQTVEQAWFSLRVKLQPPEESVVRT